MSQHTKDCDEYRGLLMGLMDDELTPDEAVRTHDHLRRCTACRDEYEGLRRMAGKIAAVSFVKPQEEVLRTMWNSPYTRLTRGAGLLMVLAGWLPLVLYGAY